MNCVLIPLVAGLSFQDPAGAEPKAWITRWAERCKGVRTISADFVQDRKSPLLDDPVRSSGKLSYRREKEKLALVIQKPRDSVVHLDRGSYQVYRPEDKQLEQYEFEDSERGHLLFMVFNPNMDELEKCFTVKAGASTEGQVEVVLEPTDRKYLKILNRITLILSDAGDAAKITLKSLAYVDPEGEEVRWDLAKLTVNPDLPSDAFELRVPEGTRVLKHRAKPARKE